MQFTPITEDSEDPQGNAAGDPVRHSAAPGSVVVNLLLTTLQIVVGVFAKSQADRRWHPLPSDLVADFVVLLASHHSQKGCGRRPPYGHQRFETAASLVLGPLLLAVGVGMLWSAFRKLEAPESVPQVHSAALGGRWCACVAKETLFRYMLAVAKGSSQCWWPMRGTLAPDAASSLVVGLGIVGNLAGYPILDPIAALIGVCGGWRWAGSLAGAPCTT